MDTSVWSLALRRDRPSAEPKVGNLKELIQSGQDLCLLGMILTEILQGVRERGHFEKLKEALASFPLVEPSREDYVFSAEIRNECALKGIRASTIDFLIAGTAIHHEMALLTTDADFDRIASVVPLRIV